MRKGSNTIYREMISDLLYRLRLADELFLHAASMIMSTISIGDTAGRSPSLEQLRFYARALQVIYADFLHLQENHHITFPADIELWQWYEADGEEIITQTLERLHAIAEGMELKLSSEMLKMEAKQ